jgi:hypothetical protein
LLFAILQGYFNLSVGNFVGGILVFCRNLGLVKLANIIGFALLKMNFFILTFGAGFIKVNICPTI